MPKTTEQLAASKAGETLETNGFGSQERPLRPSGVYELKNEDGKVVDSIIVKTHPKFGDSQAAAVERVGYRYVREAHKDEVKAIEVDVKQLSTEDKAGNVTQDDLKGLQARLNALEKENADLKAGQRAEDEKGSADGDVKAGAKEDASEEAEARVQARQEGLTGVEETQRTEEIKGSEDEDSDEDDEPKEKSFSQLNRAELEELAEKEGITIPEEADTNAKIREVITKAREEKEGK